MIYSNQKINNKKRDRLFFDKYTYSIAFLIPFSATLRGCTCSGYNSDNLSQRILKRYLLYKNSHKIFENFDWITTLKDVEPNKLVHHLLNTYTFLKSLKNTKIVYQSDWITLYTNDLNCLEDLNKLSFNNLKIYKADVTIPRGYVTCRHSQHKYRIYLRHTLPSIAEHNSMKQFVNTYENYIFQSRAFKEWVHDNWNRYRPSEFYFFFETDDVGLEHILDLMVPGLKSRVCNIISNKYKLTKE